MSKRRCMSKAACQLSSCGDADCLDSCSYIHNLNDQPFMQSKTLCQVPLISFDANAFMVLILATLPCIWFFVGLKMRWSVLSGRLILSSGSAEAGLRSMRQDDPCTGRKSAGFPSNSAVELAAAYLPAGETSGLVGTWSGGSHPSMLHGHQCQKPVSTRSCCRAIGHRICFCGQKQLKLLRRWHPASILACKA